MIFFLQSGYISWEKTYKWFIENQQNVTSQAIAEETRRIEESQIRRAFTAIGGTNIQALSERIRASVSSTVSRSANAASISVASQIESSSKQSLRTPLVAAAPSSSC
jgi:hypothetical protein